MVNARSTISDCHVHFDVISVLLAVYVRCRLARVV
uniref:Transposase n=1 Tax=Ascaris lumbricoides TaxID=6252 RepID=A0A0M3IMK7_ASCLU